MIWAKSTGSNIKWTDIEAKPTYMNSEGKDWLRLSVFSKYSIKRLVMDRLKEI